MPLGWVWLYVFVVVGYFLYFSVFYYFYVVGVFFSGDSLSKMGDFWLW